MVAAQVQKSLARPSGFKGEVSSRLSQLKQDIEDEGHRRGFFFVFFQNKSYIYLYI